MIIQNLDNKDYPNLIPCELNLDDNSSLKKMLQFVGYNKCVVDFGCATGYFAKLLKERGCQVVGLEINQKAAAQARKFCDEVIVCDLDRPASAIEALQHYEFDVAVFGDVLEHLKNPWSLLKHVNLILKRSGYIVASIPNIAHGAVQLALLQGEFNYTDYGILDNTHLRFFTRHTVQSLFESSGYKIQNWDTTRLPVFSGSSSLVPHINEQDFHKSVIDTILDRPDCEVLQFIVRAFPSSQEEGYINLQSQLEQTQSQLEQTQSQLGQTQSQLEQTQSQLEQTQSQLEQTQSQRSNANDVISWVQTSKFWKLRSALISFISTKKVKVDLLTSYLDSLKSVQLTQHIKNPSVLFITHEASRTGAPIFLINAAKYIKQSLGVNCIFLLRNGGEMINEFEEIGQSYVLDDPNSVDIILINHLKAQNIKLIYSNTATNGKIQKDLKVLNLPILCHVHELQYSLESLFSSDNLDNVLSNTDIFLAGSATVADYLIHIKNVERDKVTIVYPFIDVNFNSLFKKYNHESIFTHSGYSYDRKTLIVGGCGTICWRKGTDLFIQVARQVLSKTSIPVHFVWIGGVHDEYYYNNLLHDSALMGISEYIFFPGLVSNHLSYLKDFDIFLLPSREDPFPLVMLDSASLEVPIIGFDKSGGAKEFIDKNSGYVVPYMDIEAMSDAVIQLLNNKSLREKLGNSAFQKVLTYHDISVGGQQLKSIVQEYICNTNSLEDLK